MTGQEIRSALKEGCYREVLGRIYGSSAVAEQTERYEKLLTLHEQTFGGEEVRFFSTAGRTELAGNHTDHNQGRVLAASIQLDTIAAVTPAQDSLVRIHSEGYEPFTVDISSLEPVKEEENTAPALFRGIAAALTARGHFLKGFRATLTSTVLKGSGLSSSAALEVLAGTIFNELFCGGVLSTTEIAQIGQYAENVYFNKPCGLMDQVACANGGIVMIDFKDPAHPVIEPVDYHFREKGYTLMVVDSGGNHADLTPEYAAVPAEMKGVARVMGASVCREKSEGDLLASFQEIRSQWGDRALLRGLHFMRENERVRAMEKTLQDDDMDSFLEQVRASGDSSFKFLQNVFPASHPEEQGISLALALSEGFLNGEGACRVHGGGFAGTIQVYVPNERAEDYKEFMESFFGEGTVTALRIRSRSTCRVI
ncbi:MAG: galactokinase family protein [Spirochaetales bacterium]|nr:galactokinase family protein [Spirochaetales bacterium]